MADGRAKRIELRVSNHKAYVWDLEDLALLRAQHHICGVLAGTLPHLSQQNIFLGLPLVLMPEEVVFLVQKEIAVLVDDPLAHQPPSTAQLEAWNRDRKAGVKAQIAASEAKEAVGIKAAKSTSEDAIRKRKEREQKRAAAARAKALAEGSQDLFAPPVETLVATDALASTDQPAIPSASLNSSNVAWMVTVPASSSAELEWYSSEGVTYATIEDAQAAGVWLYPSTSFERAKCAVFRDLWEKGHYMGGGIRFGADFLVYPGDPLRYHSHFAASVIESPIASLKPMEIVAHGRLGTATKKAHLLCGWDQAKQEVSYYSIEWAGFG
ncbi:tRNA-intron endonuclease catalytic domain-like protein [Cytidiella melzeri]|nr:tRNA-intron endonuclease catalytic domain-like protein [Cytidiella melzeri]